MILNNLVRSKVAFVCIFFLVIFYFPTHSEAQKSDQFVRDCFTTYWPHEKSDLHPDPALKFGRLDNGFRYVLMQNHEPQDRVAIFLNVQVGSIFENDDERGYAHFLEHMLFNGSENFKPGELVKYFQEIGMNFGGDTNAHTTFDETVYNVLLPKGDVESIKKGLIVMSDYSRGALLLNSEVERERGVILSEKLARDSVSYRTRLATRNNAFRGTILTQREPIGTNESILSATGDSLRAFYDRWYRPEKMFLIVVGDFDVDAVDSLVQQRFSSVKGVNGLPDCPVFGKVEHKGLNSFYYYEPDDGKVEISIESYWNTGKENDSFARQKQDLLEYFSTRILSRRLELLAEKKGGLFTRPQAYSGDVLGKIGYSGLTLNTSEENWRESLGVLESSLRKILTYGVTESEVEVVRKELSSSFESAVLTAETRDSTFLARQIIRSLNANQVFQSPSMERELYLPVLMQFSANEISEAIRNLWAHENTMISVTGNVKIQSDSPEKLISDVYLQSQKQAVFRPVELESLTFPYLEIPAKGKEPVQNQYKNDIGVEILHYENGLILNLKKTEFNKNELEVAVNFGPGQQDEPVAGLGMLAESVVGSSGSGKLSASELESVLSGSSVEYDFEVQKTSFLISGHATSNDTEQLMQVLQTLLLDPGFREEVYSSKMMRYEQMYAALQNDINGAENLYLERFFAGGNTLFGIEPWQNFKKLQLSQLREWLKPHFQNDALEISIVGDFDRDQVVSLINKYFGSLPKRERLSVSHSAIKFPEGEKLEVKINTKIDKSLVTLAWKTEDHSDIRRTRRLHMLANILEERIRVAVREELGASYSPQAYNSSSKFIPGYGVMYAKLIVETKQIESVKKTVLRICENLIANGVEEDELRRAREPVLTLLRDTVRSNIYWLNAVLALSSANPDQLQWPTTILDDHASITAAEMTEYAKKYLRPEAAAVGIVKPE